jgi:hypothetical protein
MDGGEKGDEEGKGGGDEGDEAWHFERQESIGPNRRFYSLGEVPAPDASRHFRFKFINESA